MSPIETAEAFNAPILRKDTGHRDLGALLEQMGDRPVMYRPVEHRVGGAREKAVTVFKRMAMVKPQVESGQELHDLRKTD
jgi:hypothetical protein